MCIYIHTYLYIHQIIHQYPSCYHGETCTRPHVRDHAPVYGPFKMVPLPFKSVRNCTFPGKTDDQVGDYHHFLIFPTRWGPSSLAKLVYHYNDTSL